MRWLDREDTCVGPTTGRWLWDASRELRDKNLLKFWKKWDRFTILTQLEERYDLLITMTVQVYQVHFLGKLHNSRTRNRFNVFKETDFPLENELCRCCGGPSVIRHHIVPIKNGGHNHKLNMMPLCRLCHAEIHPWLNKKENNEFSTARMDRSADLE